MYYAKLVMEMMNMSQPSYSWMYTIYLWNYYLYRWDMYFMTCTSYLFSSLQETHKKFPT